MECCEVSARRGDVSVSLSLCVSQCWVCVSQGHFVCAACASGVTRAAMEADLGLRRTRGGTVPCPKFPTECKDTCLDDGKLAQLLPSELVGSYLGSRLKLLEVARAEELEGEYSARLE
eukprot:73561-Rhodomonas_salina.2